MNPTAIEILNKLASLFPESPDFSSHWKKQRENWSDDDGSFRFWGLFTEFSRFIRENWDEIPNSKRKELMEFIESCLGDDTEDNDLDNATCTCFLENLAGETPLSGQLKEYMGPKSLRFFDAME